MGLLVSGSDDLLELLTSKTDGLRSFEFFFAKSRVIVIGNNVLEVEVLTFSRRLDRVALRLTNAEFP